MRTIAWLVAGLALLGLKGYLEGMAAAGGESASLKLIPIVAMLAASTCFYRALRSALAMIVFRGSPKASGSKPTPAKPSLVARVFAAPPAEQFDADAAFERYMQQREANPSDEPVEIATRPVKSPAPPSFGRRVL